MTTSKNKIQPSDIADATPAGQTPATEATEIPDITPEQAAGMKPEEVTAYITNAKKFIRSATQKSQETAEVKRQNEQIAAESKYWKSQAETMQTNLQKVYEQMAQPRQTTTSTPSQPPEYDEYNPRDWARNYQKWHDDRFGQMTSQNEDLRKTVETLKEEFNVGLRTINVERYLEKAIPKLGPQVDADEILLWFQMHPDVQASTETINQAITERQAKINTLAEVRAQEYLAAKEQDAAQTQDAASGAPWAGGGSIVEDFADKTPAEREEIVRANLEKEWRSLGGGG